MPEAQETLFDPHTGLVRGSAPFDAQFKKVSLTQADRPQLLQDVENLAQMPERLASGSRGPSKAGPFTSA